MAETNKTEKKTSAKKTAAQQGAAKTKTTMASPRKSPARKTAPAKKAVPKKTAATRKAASASKPKPEKTVKVTLVKSVIGTRASHRATVRGLGLRRIRHSVELEDTPAVRGMINKVGYLLRVEA